MDSKIYIRPFSIWEGKSAYQMNFHYPLSIQIPTKISFHIFLSKVKQFLYFLKLFSLLEYKYISQLALQNTSHTWDNETTITIKTFQHSDQIS